MRHHAFFIEAPVEEGIAAAHAYAKRELGLDARKSPDVITLSYGLFSVDDARRAGALAAQAPVAGAHKALVIAAERAYHEAQNALLKVFEEPAEGTTLFLVLPSSGSLLPTLRSRVVALPGAAREHSISEEALAFLKAGKEKRSAVIKKLASGKDEDERRARRSEAIALLGGIERAAYERLRVRPDADVARLLEDIAALRGYLYDRSAPVRMILEHVSLVLPQGLV
jgi:hypothetical protein